MKKLTLFISLAACAFVAKADRYQITCCDGSIHIVTYTHEVIQGNEDKLPVLGSKGEKELAHFLGQLHCSNGCYISVCKIIVESGPNQSSTKSQPALKTESLKKLLKTIRDDNKVALCAQAEQQ